MGVPVTIILSLGSALFINSLGKGKGIFQTIYFLPYVTSTIAIGLVFRWLFHSDYGYINHVLSFLGFAPQKWLTDPNLTTISVTIFTIWNGMAFKIVLFLAGLQKIDPQYYQAARMDETPPHRVFFRITMPLLSSTFWMVTIVSVIHAFKTYNEVYSMFGGNGAWPGNSAITIVYYIYDMFFNRSQVHYASAAAIIFFVIILALTGTAEMGIEKIRSLRIRKEDLHDRKTENSSSLDSFNSRSINYDVSFHLDVSYLLKDTAGGNRYPPTLFPAKAIFANYKEAFTMAPFGRYLFNSISVAGLVRFVLCIKSPYWLHMRLPSLNFPVNLHFSFAALLQ